MSNAHRSLPHAAPSPAAECAAELRGCGTPPELFPSGRRVARDPRRCEPRGAQSRGSSRRAADDPGKPLGAADAGRRVLCGRDPRRAGTPEAATSAATRQTSIVSVSTIDSFAARWLMPRLSRFRRAHGDIDVRVATSERPADFVSDGIDIAIRCGGGQYPGLSAELLMTEDHFPVCSPNLLKGRHRVAHARRPRAPHAAA